MFKIKVGDLVKPINIDVESPWKIFKLVYRDLRVYAVVKDTKTNEIFHYPAFCLEYYDESKPKTKKENRFEVGHIARLRGTEKLFAVVDCVDTERAQLLMLKPVNESEIIMDYSPKYVVHDVNTFKHEDIEKEKDEFAGVKEKCERIIKHYGLEHQCTIAVEELSELQKECCKLVRCRQEKKPYDSAKLIDELADVQIMLWQLSNCVDNGRLKQRITYKIARQMQRIDDEVYKHEYKPEKAEEGSDLYDKKV